MTYTIIQFRKVSLSFYVLSILLLFYLIFNLWYTWFGISLIVRVYLYVFSFFMIYTYSISSASLCESLKPDYLERFGKKGLYLLRFESSILPFLSIFGIMAIYIFIDYMKEDNWPWNPLLLLFGGRYSNLLAYSLILHFILNIRRRPLVAVPAFITISLAYFILDSMIYTKFPIGPAVSVYRICKFSFFMFLLLYNFFGDTKELLKTAAKAILGAVVFYLFTLLFYTSVYYFSKSKYFAHNKTGLVLLKMGYSFPLRDLQKDMIEKKDVSIISDMFLFGNYYNIIPRYSEKEWQNMLFSQKSKRADEVALYMVRYKQTVPASMIIGYVEERISANDLDILTAKNFTDLSAVSFTGKEKLLMRKIDTSGKEFTIWGIKVLQMTENINTVPFLIRYLTHIDDSISGKAYEALRRITGIDPSATLKAKINSPEIIEAFKIFYEENRDKQTNSPL